MANMGHWGITLLALLVLGCQNEKASPSTTTDAQAPAPTLASASAAPTASAPASESKNDTSSGWKEVGAVRVKRSACWVERDPATGPGTPYAYSMCRHCVYDATADSNTKNTDVLSAIAKTAEADGCTSRQIGGVSVANVLYPTYFCCPFK